MQRADAKTTLKAQRDTKGTMRLWMLSLCFPVELCLQRDLSTKFGKPVAIQEISKLGLRGWELRILMCSLLIKPSSTSFVSERHAGSLASQWFSISSQAAESSVHRPPSSQGGAHCHHPIQGTYCPFAVGHPQKLATKIHRTNP